MPAILSPRPSPSTSSSLAFPSCSRNSAASIMSVCAGAVQSGLSSRATLFWWMAMPDPIAKIKQKLQEEIDQLEHELNVELPKEIAVARAHGDLSENAEYKYAKERQGFVNARIGQLKKRMGDLGMLNLTNIPKDRSGYGSRILVLDTDRDVKIEYKLV